MATPENDALEDLAYATSEGPSDQWESADPGATDSGDYGDYGDLAAGDAGDYGDYGDYGDAGDLGDFGDAGDLGDPYEPDAADFGDFAGEDPIGVEEAEESVSQTIASMLGAESEDQFFGNLIRGARNLIKKAAPIVGKIARGAAPILRLIPHPIAQGAATVAGVLGKLKAEGASVEDALEAVAEVAARDTRALPIVAGLAARSVLKGTAARLPPAQRQQVARAVTRAAANLVAAGGPTAIRALPKVAASVRRTAANNGTPPPARPRVLVRTVARLAQNPAALRNLSTPSPRARQIIASVRRTGMGNGGMGNGGMGNGGMGSGGTGYGGYGGGSRRARRIRISGPATIFIRSDG